MDPPVASTRGDCLQTLWKVFSGLPSVGIPSVSPRQFLEGNASDFKTQVFLQSRGVTELMSQTAPQVAWLQSILLWHCSSCQEIAKQPPTLVIPLLLSAFFVVVISASFTLSIYRIIWAKDKFYHCFPFAFFLMWASSFQTDSIAAYSGVRESLIKVKPTHSKMLDCWISWQDP